jgi:hypothetical protein
MRARAASRRRDAAPPEPGSRSRVWLPVLTLLLGSALTLATTVISGRISAADDRERERESFLREQRVDSYSSYTAALLAREHALDDVAATLLDDDPAGDAALEEAVEELIARGDDVESERARISIVGSRAIVEEAHAAYGRSSVVATALIGAVYDHDSADAVDRTGVYGDFVRIIQCSASYPRIEFTMAAQFDIGATTSPPEPTPACDDALDDYR